MIVARPFGVKDLRALDNGSYRFTVVVLTSLGPVGIEGFMLDKRQRLLAPGVPVGNGHFHAWVTLTPHARSLVKKLALRAVEQRLRRTGESDAGRQPPAHHQVP